MKITEGLSIEVRGLPNSQVGPNSRNFYKKKNSYFQKEKNDFYDLLIMSGHQLDPLWQHVAVHFTFHAADRRRRDIDNLIACAKPWIDAMQGVLIPGDDSRHLQQLSASYYNCEGKESYTEVAVTNLDAKVSELDVRDIDELKDILENDHHQRQGKRLLDGIG